VGQRRGFADDRVGVDGGGGGDRRGCFGRGGRRGDRHALHRLLRRLSVGDRGGDRRVLLLGDDRRALDGGGDLGRLHRRQIGLGDQLDLVGVEGPAVGRLLERLVGLAD